jgi:hypothetical protein
MLLVVLALGGMIYMAYKWHTEARTRPRWVAGLYNRWRGPDPSPADKRGFAPVSAPEVPTLRVVTVGLSGSGKSVLLATMAHWFSTAEHQPYLLLPAATDTGPLNRLYLEIKDPLRDWPASTAAGSKRTFEFDVKTEVELHRPAQTICRLHYLEYGGELLTETQLPGSSGEVTQRDLFKDIEEAHALIGVIDGRYLTGLLQKKHDKQNLAFTLNALVDATNRSSCPITFIVTKWDQVVGSGGNERRALQGVRDVLMEHQNFAYVVRRQAQFRPVRLIPVSSVGWSFAHLSGNRMVKARDGRIRPTNIDVPLSSVLPDLVSQVAAKLDERNRNEVIAAAQARRGRSSLSATAQRDFSRSLLNVVGTAAAGPLGSLIFVGFALIAAYAADASSRRSSMQAQALDPPPVNREIAHEKVLGAMREKVTDLERRLPECRFTGGVGS